MAKKIGALIIHPGAKPVLEDISLDVDSIATILGIKSCEVSECFLKDFCFFLPGYISGRYCIEKKEFHSSIIIVKCSPTMNPYKRIWLDGNQEFVESFNITEAKGTLKMFGFSTVVIDRRAFPGANLDKVPDYIGSILESKEISFQAKGLLCLLISHNFTLPIAESNQYSKEETINIQDILAELFRIGLFKNANYEVEFCTGFFNTNAKERVEVEKEMECFPVPEVLIEQFEMESAETKERTDSKKEDELFELAKQLVIEKELASVSMLQRKFHIGYTRAARLIDRLEDEGIVGPYVGSKARKVLVEKIGEECK